MRILMLSDVYFPRVNGVSTSIETFRRDLLAAGHEVVLVAPSYPRMRDEAGVLRISSRRVPRDAEDRIMLWPSLRRRLRALAREHWDVVHVHTPFVAHYAGTRFASRARAPLVITYHTLFEEYLSDYVPLVPARAMRALARRFSRRQCTRAEAVIVPSTAMSERLAAYHVTRDRLHVLPTGLPAADYIPGDAAGFRTAHAIAPNRPVALYAGRVAREKNIGFLLDAFRLVHWALPDALLLVAGGGSAERRLRARAERLGLGGAVRFMGYVPRGPELAAAYSAADLFVFASRTETQGLVLLEAMAQGTPVLALAEMGTRDVVERCAGAVAGADRVEDFARQWLELLREPRHCRSLGEQARGAAEAWRSDVLAARLAALYASLSARPRSRGRLARPKRRLALLVRRMRRRMRSHPLEIAAPAAPARFDRRRARARVALAGR